MGDLQFTLPPVEKSKKQVAYEFIKEHIVSGDFPAGSLLVERQLCAMINTSRTPVREAIQQLTAEGLVESISAKGNVVSSIRYEDIARTYDVREYLESLAVRLCVQVCTDAQMEALAACTQRMLEAYKSGDLVTMYQEDNQFHLMIIQNSQNTLLINIYESFLDRQIRRITQLIGNNLEGMKKSNAHHQELMEALRQRDGDLAEQVIRRHIQDSKISHLTLFAPNIQLRYPNN